MVTTGGGCSAASWQRLRTGAEGSVWGSGGGAKFEECRAIREMTRQALPRRSQARLSRLRLSGPAASPSQPRAYPLGRAPRPNL